MVDLYNSKCFYLFISCIQVALELVLSRGDEALSRSLTTRARGGDNWPKVMEAIYLIAMSVDQYPSHVQVCIKCVAT